MQTPIPADASGPIDGTANAAGTRTGRTIGKMRRGGLPASVGGKTWVGLGTSKNCSGCGEPVTADDREFEIEVAETLSFRFHAECYQAWLACGDARDERPGP